jgi:hypothetical protein
MYRFTFFLTWALLEVSGQLWVGPRVGLNNVETRKFLNLPGLELRPLGRPPTALFRQAETNFHLHVPVAVSLGGRANSTYYRLPETGWTPWALQIFYCFISRRSE